LDVVSAFKNILDIARVKLTVDETGRYTQQEILKSVNSFTFCPKTGKWEDVTGDEMHMVLALFMVMGILQRLHLDHTTQRTACVCIFILIP
jgi:hypothetical protein